MASAAAMVPPASANVPPPLVPPTGRVAFSRFISPCPWVEDSSQAVRSPSVSRCSGHVPPPATGSGVTSAVS